MKTKNAHIIEAMRLPATAVIFPTVVAKKTISLYIELQPSNICCHCFLENKSNGDIYCSRQSCLTSRKSKGIL